MSGTQGGLIGARRTPTSIVNGFSAGGYHYSGNAVNQVCQAGKATLSGALTAGVLATVASLTGPGVLYIVAADSVDATSRTHRLKLTLDGVVVFDATSDAVTAAAYGIMAVGEQFITTTYLAQIIGERGITFETSCLIEYASSVSETAKTYYRLKYTL